MQRRVDISSRQHCHRPFGGRHLARQQLGQDIPIEKSFQLTQAAFQEGRPSEKSTPPVFKARWMIDQLKEKEGSTDATLGKSFWPLLERPVLIAWKVVLPTFRTPLVNVTNS